MADEESRKRLFLQRNMDVNGGTAKMRRFDKGEESVLMGRFDKGEDPLLKLLVPDFIARHIIRRGVQELERTYGGNLELSNDNEYYPGTRERFLVIRGKPSELADINYYIMDTMTYVDPSIGIDDPIYEGLEEIQNSGRGDKTLVVVTNKFAGIVIGTSGSSVKLIKADTGADIDISGSWDGDGYFGDERILSLTGTLQQRNEALKCIIAKIPKAKNKYNIKTNYNNNDNNFPLDIGNNNNNYNNNNDDKNNSNSNSSNNNNKNSPLEVRNGVGGGHFNRGHVDKRSCSSNHPTPKDSPQHSIESSIANQFKQQFKAALSQSLDERTQRLGGLVQQNLGNNNLGPIQQNLGNNNLGPIQQNLGNNNLGPIQQNFGNNNLVPLQQNFGNNVGIGGAMQQNLGNKGPIQQNFGNNNLGPVLQNFGNNVGIGGPMQQNLGNKGPMQQNLGNNLGMGGLMQQQNFGNNIPRDNALKSKMELELDVPLHVVGHLMGEKGSGVKEMWHRSGGARIEFSEYDKDHGCGGVRKLMISGDFEQTTKAYHIVHNSIEQWQQQKQQHNISHVRVSTT